MLTRRALFAGAGAVAAGAIGLEATRSEKPAVVDSKTGWEAVRAEFDLDPAIVHLSLFYLTPHPRAVRNAVEAHRQRLDANPYETVHGTIGVLPPAAEAIASYIGAGAADIALTQNTTTGLSIAYHGLPLRPGEEILTTAHDHYAHHEAIRLAATRAGATWRKIALFDSHDAVDADVIVERIRKGIGPKTRILGITWVHSSTGLKLPLQRIAAAVGEINARRDAKQRVRIVVDGVHGIGVEDPGVAATGIDVFAAGTHKWLFAPRGTGFVWARSETWASMQPLLPTFSALEPWMAWAANQPPSTPPRASWFTPGGFQAFEHWWAVPEAIDMHRRIGSARITERIHALNGHAKEELAKMPNVVLYTPRSSELSAGIICFDVKGKTQEEAVATLRDRDLILASMTPYVPSYARIAFSIQNNEDDVERTLRAIRAL